MAPTAAPLPTLAHFIKDLAVEDTDDPPKPNHRKLSRITRAIVRSVHEGGDGVSIDRIARVLCVDDATVQSILANRMGDDVSEDKCGLTSNSKLPRDFRAHYFPELEDDSEGGPDSGDDKATPTHKRSRPRRKQPRKPKKSKSKSKREYWPNPTAQDFKNNITIPPPNPMGTRTRSKKLDRIGRGICRIMNDLGWNFVEIAFVFGVAHNPVMNACKNIYTPGDPPTNEYDVVGGDFLALFPPANMPATAANNTSTVANNTTVPSKRPLSPVDLANSDEDEEQPPAKRVTRRRRRAVNGPPAASTSNLKRAPSPVYICISDDEEQNSVIPKAEADKAFPKVETVPTPQRGIPMTEGEYPPGLPADVDMSAFPDVVAFLDGIRAAEDYDYSSMGRLFVLKGIKTRKELQTLARWGDEDRYEQLWQMFRKHFVTEFQVGVISRALRGLRLHKLVCFILGSLGENPPLELQLIAAPSPGVPQDLAGVPKCGFSKLEKISVPIRVQIAQALRRRFIAIPHYFRARVSVVGLLPDDLKTAHESMQALIARLSRSRHADVMSQRYTKLLTLAVLCSVDSLRCTAEPPAFNRGTYSSSPLAPRPPERVPVYVTTPPNCPRRLGFSITPPPPIRIPDSKPPSTRYIPAPSLAHRPAAAATFRIWVKAAVLIDTHRFDLRSGEAMLGWYNRWLVCFGGSVGGGCVPGIEFLGC
ncbi:hypothetical protein C8R43DRAFT_940430 [Mycena crocata]|nr:hypothetical protein C8R43DRAFT_940430 [Mycena crocata]